MNPKPLFFLLAVLFAALAIIWTHNQAINSARIARSAVGDMMCFSVIPPDIPATKATTSKPATYPSCDELCAAKHAACVGAAPENGELILPLPACGDPSAAASSSSTRVCRCCRVSQ